MNEAEQMLDKVSENKTEYLKEQELVLFDLRN